MSVLVRQLDKKTRRQRRARKARLKISELGLHRLSVHRSPRHIYAQIVSPGTNARVIVSAASVEAQVKTEFLNKRQNDKQSKQSKIACAKVIGKLIAERAQAAGVTKVAFDRGGYLYHGRVKALADAAREAGLNF